MNCDLIAVFASDLGTCERTQRCFTLIHIGYLHISRNSPCLFPQILHKHCLLFLLGLQQYPREIEDNVYEKLGGGRGAGGKQGLLWEMCKWQCFHVLPKSCESTCFQRFV